MTVNNRRLRSRYCTVEAITADIDEASRCLSATAELNVLVVAVTHVSLMSTQ